MDNIYNFWKNAIQEIKENSRNASYFYFLILLLVTIPLPFAVNNIALVLLLLSVVLKSKEHNFLPQRVLFLPIAMFVLMAISYFWSIDKNETLKAIPKEIVLFLLPILFMKMRLTISQKNALLKYYSYSIVGVTVYFLLRALLRFLITQDSRAFFYHGEDHDDFGLVPKLLNAIHVSVFVAVAFFYFFTKEVKSKVDIIFALLLSGFVILLSSKNVILIFILLIAIYYFFYSKASHKMRLRNLIVFVVIVAVALSFGKIKQRFKEEFRNNTTSSISPTVLSTLPNGIHNISIYEAWNNETFSPNDYFPGTAFRVYQIRMFIELLQEEPILITGFGLNASKIKLLEKEKKYNLYSSYGSFNFHNQYIQNFAELGLFGFLILVIMLLVSLKKAINNKDFIHFSFTILMISLFLTESFLWRQRGVVFFTLLFCVFNVVKVNNQIKES